MTGVLCTVYGAEVYFPYAFRSLPYIHIVAVASNMKKSFGEGTPH